MTDCQSINNKAIFSKKYTLQHFSVKTTEYGLGQMQDAHEMAMHMIDVLDGPVKQLFQYKVGNRNIIEIII